MLSKPIRYPHRLARLRKLRGGPAGLFIWLLFSLLASGFAQAQAPGAPASQPIPSTASLPECISFALRNQPVVRQSQLDEEIGERNIRIGLSAWLPQINATGIYTRNIQLPTAVFPDLTNPGGPQQIFRIGLNNTSTLGVAASQLLFSNDVLLAARSVRPTRLAYQQTTTANKIDVVTNVSKAFYDILLTERQLAILDEAIQRQQLQVKDSKAKLDVGVADKTDYLRASVSLRNAYAQRQGTAAALPGKYSALKQLMGLGPEKPLALQYDTLQMVREAQLDTAERLVPERRIEVQQLLTQKKLQGFNIDYYRYGFLPTLSGFYNYNRVYQSNQFSELYRTAYPNQQAGAQFALPLFTGLRRLQNLKIARLQDERLDLDLFDTKNQITTEFDQALGVYKGALSQLNALQDNLVDAKEVYRVINLQYREGIKTFLELTIAEADLRTAQLNYYNALFNVLSSKLDVQRALGNITFNQ
ncbi:TolC family protein [Hymenobacter bucti]|uniref:TolC family protein n=1 Tax=Hymenobacter bucti TaxID=1844114 RepID=A0ABW4QQ85_9BACT